MHDSKRLYQLRIAAGGKNEERDYWLRQLAGQPVKTGFPGNRKKKKRTCPHV